jgi:ABC-type sugar transport system permease subunit
MLVLIGFPFVGAYLIFYGAIMNLPKEYFEASRVEGCSWIKRIIKIDIPLIAPQIKYIFIITFIGAVQEFNLVYLTTQGGPGHATYTPMLEMYNNVTQFQNYGLASAMGLFMFVLLFGATLINLRINTNHN